ncbi:MAG: NlpC/P60 family protein [Candidatus Babeliales bacterium]
MVFTTKTMTMSYVVGVFIVLITLQQLSAQPVQTLDSDLDKIASPEKIVLHTKKASKQPPHRRRTTKKKHALRIMPRGKKQSIDASNSQDSQQATSPKKRVLKEVRHNIIASAKKFLDHPYISTKNQVAQTAHTSSKKSKKNRGHHIDCSELVQRAYADNKLPVPRTACIQFLKCNKIKDNVAERLKPADLVFTARAKNPGRIDHVMVYMGNGILLESTGAHGKVRIIPIKRRSGKFLAELPYGKRAGKYVYYYGSFFKKKSSSATSDTQDTCTTSTHTQEQAAHNAQA